MTISVRNVFKQGIKDYVAEKRNQWSLAHPGQVVLDASRYIWTADVEKALFEEGQQGIAKYAKFLTKQLT